jgi:transposase
MSGFEDLDDEDIESLLKIWKTHEEIIKLRKEGKSMKEIAKIVGWSYSTVRTFLKTNQFSPDYKR